MTPDASSPASKRCLILFLHYSLQSGALIARHNNARAFQSNYYKINFLLIVSEINLSGCTRMEDDELENSDKDNSERLAGVVLAVASHHEIGTVFVPSGSLVDGGFTSVAMVELMLAVEREFDVTIPDCEMTALNFSSIESLSKLVAKLTSRNARGFNGQSRFHAEINSLSNSKR